MESEDWVRIEHRGAREPAEQIDLEDAARELLEGDPTPGEYVGRLVEAGLHRDAVSFLARALPSREATWWACLCVREALGEELSEDDRLALELAEAWVRDPVEERGREANDHAETHGHDSAAAWCGVAAFWSGPSLSPADQPAVPPPPGLNARATAGAILLAAAHGDPEGSEERMRRFVELGAQVAAGRADCPEPSSRPTEPES